MAEQVHPLSLAEDAHVALLMRLHRDAIARADAELSRGMSVFCVQLKAPDGTRFNYEPAVGALVPARLVYEVPDIPQTPVGDLAAEVSA